MSMTSIATSDERASRAVRSAVASDKSGKRSMEQPSATRARNVSLRRRQMASITFCARTEIGFRLGHYSRHHASYLSPSATAHRRGIGHRCVQIARFLPRDDGERAHVRVISRNNSDAHTEFVQFLDGRPAQADLQS